MALKQPVHWFHLKIRSMETMMKYLKIPIPNPFGFE